MVALGIFVETAHVCGVDCVVTLIDGFDFALDQMLSVSRHRKVSLLMSARRAESYETKGAIGETKSKRLLAILVLALSLSSTKRMAFVIIRKIRCKAGNPKGDTEWDRIIGPVIIMDGRALRYG